MLEIRWQLVPESLQIKCEEVKLRICQVTSGQNLFLFYFWNLQKSWGFSSYRLLGDTENAIKSLSKAVDILRITHGMNTPFMKELSIKLEEARAEASYMLSSNSLS